MIGTDDPVLGFLARRCVSPQWRGFLRSLMETLDANLEPAGRDSLLRIVGGRMALLHPLPDCDSLAVLEARMNDVLATIDWGFVHLFLDDVRGRLTIRHAAVPAIPTDNDPVGAWIGVVLEGLFGAWLAVQPGALPDIPVRVIAAGQGAIDLAYGSD